MDRRVILLALLLSACSGFIGDLPKPDIVVAADGSGDFKTIQSALASIHVDNRERIVVFIKNGTYREKIRVDASFVTLRGQSRNGTRIEYPQLKDDFTAHPDDIGWAVINLNHANDFVLQNLTAENTANTVLTHAFTISGTGDRIVVVDCDVLSHGGNTLALGRRERGRYYHARCNFTGSVDFVCPRGWCYLVDCNFYASTKNACVWHGGEVGRKMKFAMRNCRFDGVNGFILGRSSTNAHFYFVDCKFSGRMADEPIHRIIYPLKAGWSTEGDLQRNAGLERRNLGSQRAYFHNCHRNVGDFGWFANNLSSAPGSPEASQVTATWIFDGKWNPENESGPAVQRARVADKEIALAFNEPVTVKGKPRLKMCSGRVANYLSGSGTDTLLFGPAADSADEVSSVDLNGSAIIACEASVTVRRANISIAAGQKFTTNP